MALPLRWQPTSKPTTSVRKLTVVPGRRRAARFAISLTVLVCIVMMGAIYVHTRIAERQLEIDQLQRSVLQAQEDFDVLRAQRADLRLSLIHI